MIVNIYYSLKLLIVEVCKMYNNLNLGVSNMKINNIMAYVFPGALQVVCTLQWPCICLLKDVKMTFSKYWGFDIEILGEEIIEDEFLE